jgi:hypothetical protein
MGQWCECCAGRFVWRLRDYRNRGTAIEKKLALEGLDFLMDLTYNFGEFVRPGKSHPANDPDGNLLSRCVADEGVGVLWLAANVLLPTNHVGREAGWPFAFDERTYSEPRYLLPRGGVRIISKALGQSQTGFPK